MIVIKPKDQSETKTLLVLVSRGPGRPQYENDTGGCGTLFLMGGGGRANVQLSMSRGRYNVMITSITVVVISFKEWSQKLLVKECFFFFFCLRIGTVYMYL